MRLFDCILYNGEIETLEIRLHELDAVVDVFVIVEATRTFSGLAKPLHLREQWTRVRPFAQKIRYVVVDEDETADGDATAPVDAWARERLHRNAIVRGLRDAEPDDLVLIADVDEIPRAEVLRKLRTLADGGKEGGVEGFGLVLTLSYFALNYVHTAGPEVDLITVVVVPRARLDAHNPDTLRHGIRNGGLPAIRIWDAGWHFSYLSDRAGIVAKIRAFSHQEYNTADFLDALDPEALIAGQKDLFGRTDYAWAIVAEADLPECVQAAPARFAHLILTPDGRFAAPPPPPAEPTARPLPIILCPYVHETDRDRVVAAFGLDTERGRHLPFHLWKDEAMQGPERAFAEGWARFPDRDVIILHTDMAPMPDDADNAWYTQLLAAVAALPAAGLIACDLLYPLQAETGAWYVQCAGGWFKNGELGHIGGHVDWRNGTASIDAELYDSRFAQPRPADWVTFGGVYIRRTLIDMVGDFDPDYRWAYVMDTDYALEATVRGSEIYQVPVTLLHEENGSTRSLLNDVRYSEAVTFNHAHFRKKWGLFLERRELEATKSRGRHHSAATLLAIRSEPDWRARNAAAMMAEARSCGSAFQVAAYIRALAPMDLDAVTATEVEAAYHLILDRAADPGARTSWQGEIAQRSITARELVTHLCKSAEFAILMQRYY